MNIDVKHAWHSLNNSVSNIMSKNIEIINPDPKTNISKIIFQWVNLARFNESTQGVELIFSEEIKPYLFNLERFIKYKLINVKSLNNKYSTRMYEILLAELGKSKTNKKQIIFDLMELKKILKLEASYKTFKQFNSRVLKVVINDINLNSNLSINAKTLGRPAKAICFDVSIDSNKETKKEKKAIIKHKKNTVDNLRIDNILKIIEWNILNLIEIDSDKIKFINNMKDEYYIKKHFKDITSQQEVYLDSIINYYCK